MPCSLKNNKGFSLVELLIGAGVMVVVMAGFMSMMATQNRETKAVAEVLASMDLQKNLIVSLFDGSVCGYMLNNPAPLTFDSTVLPQTVTPSSPLYASVTLGTPGPIVAQVGEAPSVYANSMIVKSIKLNITEGVGTVYKGNWLIEFDEKKSVRAHKPIAISTIFNVDKAVPTAAKFVSCMSGNTNAYIQQCPAGQVMLGYAADGTIKCKVMASGGGGLTCTSGHMSLGGYVCDIFSAPL